MFTVYILKSRITGKHYTGYTSNLDERLKQHNSGKNKSTKRDAPWDIVYSEVFSTKVEAWKRERKIKSYKGGEAFKKLIECPS